MPRPDSSRYDRSAGTGRNRTEGNDGKPTKTVDLSPTLDDRFTLVSTLAERVREERLWLGWTQGEVADRSGIDKRSYQRFEQSARVTWPRLQRVLAALGLSLAIVPADGDLMNNSPPPDLHAM